MGEARCISADISSRRMLVSPPWPASLDWASWKWHRLPTFDPEFNLRVSMRADGRAGEHGWRVASRIRECRGASTRFGQGEFS